eukprot:6319632-Amphidinium_carterae.1
MPPIEACKVSVNRARQGLDTISCTGVDEISSRSILERKGKELEGPFPHQKQPHAQPSLLVCVFCIHCLCAPFVDTLSHSSFFWRSFKTVLEG